MSRKDVASRVIRAPAQRLYEAHLDPDALAQWRAPTGMRAEIYAFDPREGGGYRMALIYTANDRAARGKTTESSDEFEGRFVELVPGERVVERVHFETDVPEMRGPMTVTTTFVALEEGTEVRIVCENVPSGISAEDHAVGMASTLANLAAFVE